MFTVKEILEITNGKLISGSLDTTIESFSKDTRTITDKDMYIAIKGETFDGNKFTADALNKGAIGAMINEDLEENSDKVIIKVEDSIKALAALATHRREKYNIPVVAITGSVGKTSTKDIIASILSSKYKVLKTEGNLNTRIGISLTLLNLKDHEAIVLEMGMNNLGQISRMTAIAKPTIAVITNIGTSHIGILGSRENILKAKLEILEGMKADGIVIINNDNDLLHTWSDTKYNVKTYGTNENSNYYAYNIETNKFLIDIDKETYSVEMPAGGNHFVYNCLAGITVGKTLNIETNEIVKSIKNTELTKMRMELKERDGITIINDAYNASPESIKPALEYFSSLKRNRKIVVLGDIKELGDFSKETHENVGKLVKDIDILITIGEEAKYIAENAKSNEIYSFTEREQAIELLSNILRPGDAMLIKASNSMKLYEMEDKIWEKRK